MKTSRLLAGTLACALCVPPLVLAQASTPGAAPANSQAKDSNTRNDAQAIEDLLAAEQRLREAIQAMAQAPAGDKRTTAIRQGNVPLREVQGGVVRLPSNLLLANATESDYRKAMDKLQRAAQRLREAAQALAQEPAGPKRNAAIKQINEALVETNQVMMFVPPSPVKGQKPAGQK